MAAYDIGNAFDVIEKELIASMIRNMSRHRAEETKEGYMWSQWQAEQLKSLEKYKIQNRKKYGSQFKNLNRQMEALIRLSKEQGGMEQEREILKAIKNGFTGYKKVGSTMQAEFFKLNERKLESLIRATESDMKKAETAVLRMVDDQYRKIIFNAQVYANTGAGTYKQAVDMATKDFLSAGLNGVEYANGARHTLSDYAQMAIRTASKRAYLQGEGEKRQEWGISTVIVNKRGNPCPKCLPFVGKVLIDDVWSGGSSADGNYPLMSKAVAAGLYHPNCKDSHTTYFQGISTADDTWTMEELEAIEKKNKQGAKEQYARRQAEKYSRLAEYSLDPENKRIYKHREDTWKQEMHDITYEKFNDEHIARREEELLPQYESVQMDDNKFTGYALNKEHPTGRNKAIAFERYLGYTIRNQDTLKQEVRKGLSKYKCVKRTETKYGQPYEVAMLIKGVNGKYSRVKTGWIIDKGSSIPRLTSIYVDE